VLICVTIVEITYLILSNVDILHLHKIKYKNIGTNHIMYLCKVSMEFYGVKEMLIYKHLMKTSS